MNCGKGNGWKSWLMTVGCLSPLIIIIVAPYLGFTGQYLTLLTFLVCPLAMFFMMYTNKEGKK